MVEANTDPEVVTSRIKREMRDAAAEREREAAMVVETPSMAVEDPSAVGTLAVETVPSAPSRRSTLKPSARPRSAVHSTRAGGNSLRVGQMFSQPAVVA